MTAPQPDFWFPAKSYGWGWGLPVKWQGWLVLLAYFALTFWGIRHFKAQRDVQSLLIYLAAQLKCRKAANFTRGVEGARESDFVRTRAAGPNAYR